MSDNRYGYSDRGRGRSDSIFSDDDRHSSGGRGSSGRGDERGFLQRAGEEVMNWFSGDDHDRSRREMPRERGDYGAYQRGREGQSGQQGRQDYGREFSRQASYHGQDYAGVGQSRGGKAHHLDDHYLSWRERQIQQLDQEYEEYCRHRQEQFEKEFHGWRERQSGERMSGGRPSQGEIAAGGAAAGMTGGQAGIASGRTGSSGQSEGSGATTSGSTGGGSTGGSQRDRSSQDGASSSGEAMPSGGATASGGSALGDQASTGSSGGGTRGRAKTPQ